MALLETFTDISRHGNDARVALADAPTAFLSAAQTQDIKAIIFDGYKNDALDEYLNSVDFETIGAFTIPHIVIGQDRDALRERLPAPVFQAVDELADLFMDASDSAEIGFKLGCFSNSKMHPHLSDQMTYALDGIGTEWENGQVEGRTPFFMKSGFKHKTPDIAKDNPRPIMIFSAPSSYGL